jgi:antitoxin HicB
MRYPATITRDDNGTFLVAFPDVPEAVSFGETREEALQHGRDALLTAFDAFMKDKRDIPEPSLGARGPFVDVPALDVTKIELYRAMREGKVGKAELANRLRWHLPQVDRVLKVRHGSQLEQMEAAFAALGKKLVVSVEEDSAATTGTRANFVRAARAAVKWREKRDRPSVHSGVLTHASRGSGGHTATTGRTSGRSVHVTRRATKKR